MMDSLEIIAYCDMEFSLNNILCKYKVQALRTRKHVYIVSIHLKGIQK